MLDRPSVLEALANVVYEQDGAKVVGRDVSPSAPEDSLLKLCKLHGVVLDEDGVAISYPGKKAVEVEKERPKKKEREEEPKAKAQKKKAK